MKTRILGIFILILLISGCSHHRGPSLKEKVVPPTPVVKEAAPSASTGSLWSESSRGLFGDIRARQVGDILTVAIYEKASASKKATTATARDSSAKANLATIFGLEDKISKLNDAIDASALLDVGYENEFEGSGTTTRKEDLIATLTTQVIEVLPNGNLRIEGGKNVRVNNEDQIIRLTGIVRPMDISRDNTVDSKYVLDAEIVYTGKGVISDKQKQGWLVRILDNLWPF